MVVAKTQLRHEERMLATTDQYPYLQGSEKNTLSFYLIHLS